MTIGNAIRGTASYWKKARNHLFSMFATIGPPDLFLTLSADDLHWFDIYHAIDPSRFKRQEDVAKLSHQELTLEKVVPDCGPSIFAAGMVYNAISRVRKLEDLILLDFDPGAFKQRKNVDKEIQRLQNMKPFTPLPVIDRPSLTDLLPTSEAVEPRIPSLG